MSWATCHRIWSNYLKVFKRHEFNKILSTYLSWPSCNSILYIQKMRINDKNKPWRLQRKSKDQFTKAGGSYSPRMWWIDSNIYIIFLCVPDKHHWICVWYMTWCLDGKWDSTSANQIKMSDIDHKFLSQFKTDPYDSFFYWVGSEITIWNSSTQLSFFPKANRGHMKLN